MIFNHVLYQLELYSHTLQSIRYRPLTDVSKIGWSFTSILQVQKVGIEPTSSPPQTVPSTADLLLEVFLTGFEPVLQH